MPSKIISGRRRSQPAVDLDGVRQKYCIQRILLRMSGVVFKVNNMPTCPSGKGGGLENRLRRDLLVGSNPIVGGCRFATG